MSAGTTSVGNAGRRGRVAAIVVLAALAAGASGCSAAEPDSVPKPDAAATSEAAASGGDTAPDDLGAVPEECATAFPQAIGAPSLDEVDLLPSDWAEPVAGATLCMTSTAFGDRPSETLSYATGATPSEVLDHYESTLAGFTPARETSLTGDEMLVGARDGLAFQVRPAEGSYVILLAPFSG